MRFTMSELQNNCPSGRFRRIQPGDTLYLIALNIQTTVEELLRLNPGLDPKNLRVGSVICLPPEQVCASGLFWRVAPGDTLYKIARASNTTVSRLLELNPHIVPGNLQIGQSICLPG